MSGEHRSRRFANPYVGPKPFSGKEQNRFFGRNEEIAILEGLVLARRAVLLFAQSGAGKSSLLNAGLIPSLQMKRTVGYGVREYTYQKMHVLPVLRVGGGIPTDVQQEDIANIYTFSALMMLYPRRKHGKLVRLSLCEGLKDKLSSSTHDLSEDESDETPDTLIIFDQFEELFIYHPERWPERAKFFEQVRDALDAYPSLRVLFSMREDYIAELTPYAGLLPDRLSSQFRLERLREPAALLAICLPAEGAGRNYEEGAAKLLVEHLRGGHATIPIASDPTTPEPPAEFVEPWQLQVVCQRLWRKLPAGEHVIRREDVKRFGDVQTALQKYYEQAITDTRRYSRKANTPVGELRLRSWFDRQLITAAGTRSLVYKGVIETGGLPNAVAEFLDYRLHIVRPMIRGKDTWYELTHDRLVELVRHSNLEWRSEHAAEWQLQAQRWLQEKEQRGLLLDKQALEKAEQWIKEQGYEPEPDEQRFLDYSHQELERQAKALARQTEKRTNLAETGWGVIFAANDPQAAEIERALGELLQWRSQQAGDRYKVFSGKQGYRPSQDERPGETAQKFLTRFGVGPGLANYDRMPYYLLIIGSPDRIPFEFQYGLQTQYAVGRLDFQETLDYACYARSVVMSENGSFSLLPRVALFGPQDDQDSATTAALDKLFRPLLNTLQTMQQDRDWEIVAALQAEATRARLLDFMGGSQTPSLLFSNSWGAPAPKDDPEQETLQGAVMIQVTPSPQPGVKPESPEAYLAAHDISDDARLLGSIAFLSGAWSAGTPRFNNFPSRPQLPQELAARPFVARLPQRLLGHPKGGMLAVIGHVDMIFTSSFTWRGTDLAMNHFGGTLRRLMEGYTVGAAMEPFNQRYALLSSMLAEELQQVFFYGGKQDDYELSELNLYTVDARNFIILGDPAVRLPLENGPMTLERPIIEPVYLKAIKPEEGSIQHQEMTLQDRLLAAQAIKNDGLRALGLADLVSQFKGKDQKVVLQTAIATAQAIEDEEARARIMTLLASQLPLHFNGINGATGEYTLQSMTVAELAEIIAGERSPENLAELKSKFKMSF